MSQGVTGNSALLMYLFLLILPSQVSEEANQELTDSGKPRVLLWDQSSHRKDPTIPFPMLPPPLQACLMSKALGPFPSTQKSGPETHMH